MAQFTVDAIREFMQRTLRRMLVESKNIDMRFAYDSDLTYYRRSEPPGNSVGLCFPGKVPESDVNKLASIGGSFEPFRESAGDLFRRIETAIQDPTQLESMSWIHGSASNQVSWFHVTSLSPSPREEGMMVYTVQINFRRVPVEDWPHKLAAMA